SESSDLDSSFLSIEPEGGLCAEWNTSQMTSCNNDHHDGSPSPPQTSTPIRAKTKRPRPSRTITREQPSDYLQLPAISISQSCSESSDLDSSFLSIEPVGGLCADWNTPLMISCNNDHHDGSPSPPQTSTPIRAKTKRPRPSRTITREQPSDYLQLPAISISQSC
ncbi:unnamed protein product, partial [Owenia fusiformis]